jgi:hypothetical protein
VVMLHRLVSRFRRVAPIVIFRPHNVMNG